MTGECVGGSRDKSWGEVPANKMLCGVKGGKSHHGKKAEEGGEVGRDLKKKGLRVCKSLRNRNAHYHLMWGLETTKGGWGDFKYRGNAEGRREKKGI